MHSVTKRIIDDFQIRKTRKQKTAFIEFMKETFPEAKIECRRKSFGSRNIVIGDVENAKVIYTAHYDTCSRLPFPNFLTPKNMFIYILYSLAICLPIFVLAGILGYLANLLPESLWFISPFAPTIGVVLAMSLLLAGPPNKHTMNDNTSGVAVLVETYFAMTKEQRESVAFVFFDNEENGLLGSMRFNSMHKKALKEKLLVNFDCVSDGDHFLMVASKKALKLFGEKLNAAFYAEGEKTLSIESSSRAFYPSDQANVPCGVGAAAFNKKPILGLYISRIHTPKDTVFDERNIDCFVRGAIKLCDIM